MREVKPIQLLCRCDLSYLIKVLALNSKVKKKDIDRMSLNLLSQPPQPCFRKEVRLFKTNKFFPTVRQDKDSFNGKDKTWAPVSFFW